MRNVLGNRWWCNSEPIDGTLSAVAFRNTSAGIREDQLLGRIGTTLLLNGISSSSSNIIPSSVNGLKSTC